jgi:glycosyltransferase involved in cell wall biosynthesis
LKVAFDMQPLLDNQKTGVGYCEDGFVRNIILSHPETAFALEYFFFKNADTKKKQAANYLAPNTEISDCRKFPGTAYRFFSCLFPLPYKWFFSSGADVTHFFNAIIPPLVGGKKVVTIHDMVIRRFPETMNARTRFVLGLTLHKTVKRADIIIAVSEFSKQEILKYYPCSAPKLKVIYQGINLNAYHAGISREEIRRVCSTYNITGNYILYLGTLEPRKNIERLIEAYALLQSRQAETPVLVIAGKKGWRFEGIFRRVEALGLEGGVFFTGYIPDQDKPALLAGAQFFCFPSLYEGFGLPPLEAMACGTPVLVSNAASLPEAVGGAALLVDPYSVESIAEAMERLCVDTALREALRRRGLERVKRFDWSSLSESLYSVYASLAAS